MDLKRIVAAADESEAGRQAVRAAVALGVAARGSVTVMRALPTSRAVVGTLAIDSACDPAFVEDAARLRAWVAADLPAVEESPRVSYSVTYGHAGVEIGRFAELHGADLLVVGRKSRSRIARVLMGDTADAVARRSTIPCLFVSGQGALPRRILAAVDGTERGDAVLVAATDLARHTGAELQVVTVERGHAGEPGYLAAEAPGARSLRLARKVQAVPGGPLEVRRGDPVGEILAAIAQHRADLLVLGNHRGGPPGVIDAGSTARRLAHSATCSVLTVPL
jgi:nucleotide-binding universal stress UspA family protein